MTPGEKAIWAAAFVAAYHQRSSDATRLDIDTGALVPNDRLLAIVPMRAVMDAASAVRIARDTLPKLVAAEVKPNFQEVHREAIAMLSEMLGVPLGDVYR